MFIYIPLKREADVSTAIKYEASEYIFKKWKPGKLIIGYLVAITTYLAVTTLSLVYILYLFSSFFSFNTLECSNINPLWFVTYSHKLFVYFIGLNCAWWWNSIAPFILEIGKEILSKNLASKSNFSKTLISSLILGIEFASVV